MDSAPAVVYGPLCFLTINGTIPYDYLKPFFRLFKFLVFTTCSYWFQFFFFNIAVNCFKSIPKCHCLPSNLEKKEAIIPFFKLLTEVSIGTSSSNFF